MKRGIIFFLLQVCNCLTMISLSLITPFFPPFASSKGIDEAIMGFIISANPIGSFFASLILGKRITNSNRYSFMIFGILLQGIGLYSYVGLNWLDDKTVIIIVGVIGRLVSGVGTAFFMTPFFAFIPLLYPKDVEKKISISEFVSGGSQLVGGPVFGSLLYSLGGFTLPFIFFGALNIILIPILLLTLPKLQVNDDRQINSESFIQYDQDTLDKVDNLQDQLIKNASLRNIDNPIKKISYFQVLIKYPVFMQFMMVFASNICFTFFQPIMAGYYLKTYKIGPEEVGYLMSIVTAGYALGAFIVGYVKDGKRKLVFGGCLLLGVSYFFVGPDKDITGADHHISLTLSSQALMGFSSAFVYIPAVPLLNEILNSYYPAQPLDNANVAAALFTSGMSIGQLTGPIASGMITQMMNFERACASLGLFIFALGFVYFPMIFMEFPQPNLDQIIKENLVLSFRESSKITSQFDPSQNIKSKQFNEKSISINSLSGYTQQGDVKSEN